MSLSRRALLQGVSAVTVSPLPPMEVLDRQGSVLLEVGTDRTPQDRLLVALSLYQRARRNQEAASAAFRSIEPFGSHSALLKPVSNGEAEDNSTLIVLSYAEGQPCLFRWFFRKGYVTFAGHAQETTRSGRQSDFSDSTLWPRWYAASEKTQQANVNLCTAQEAVHVAATACYGKPTYAQMTGLERIDERQKRVAVLDGHVFIFQLHPDGWHMNGDCDIEHVTVLH